MKQSTAKKLVKLDGRTGEGGGQLVRIAVGLSSLTGIPIQIHHVRGNREGGRGGGLKAQHASCIKWLAQATKAEVTGCFVGSKEFTFRPSLPPTQLQSRKIRIDAESAASVPLVFQAIFPFLLFASDEKCSPITITIRGGTNVSFSLSYDYLNQVLLPSLESFGVPVVERKIEGCRGWAHGTRQVGGVNFEFVPLPPGKSLQASSWPSSKPQGTVTKIDITMVVPYDLGEALRASLMFELDLVFPGVEVNVLVDENSGHSARLFTLLVAHTSNGFRIGQDWVYDKSTKQKSVDYLATKVSQKLVDNLYAQIETKHNVDEYLQDQLIIFQALAEGTSMTNFSEDPSIRGRLDRTDEPFGEGSMHSKTARWVVSQLLPGVKWNDNARVCEGVGWNVAAL